MRRSKFAFRQSIWQRGTNFVPMTNAKSEIVKEKDEEVDLATQNG